MEVGSTRITHIDLEKSLKKILQKSNHPREMRDEARSTDQPSIQQVQQPFWVVFQNPQKSEILGDPGLFVHSMFPMAWIL